MNIINRVGETNLNKDGSIMIVKEYKDHRNIVVLFPDRNNTITTRYEFFKNGNVKNVYEKTVFDLGYIGDGKYKACENRKSTYVYNTWHSMLQRCYSKKYHETRPTYKDCTVVEEWHNFQNFAEWFEKNFYQIEGERMNLDKDIMVIGNKVYSPETCIFTPSKINNLFIKSNANRGKYPIGVSKHYNKYQAHGDKIRYYDTPEKAFFAYKKYKEDLIRKIAEEYEDMIPERLFLAMLKYSVNIDD